MSLRRSSQVAENVEVNKNGVDSDMSVALRKLLTIPIDVHPKVRKTVTVPQLPDELYEKIARMNIRCDKSTQFLLQWVKQNNILQVVIHLDPSNLKDMDDMQLVRQLLLQKLSISIPQAMPVDIDQVNYASKNWQIRMRTDNNFVSSMPNEYFFELARGISDEMVNMLGFKIENTDEAQFSSTSVVNVKICRSYKGEVPSKAFKTQRHQITS